MTRACYQCDENMEEIAERRNNEIRAWGREQLRVADEVLAGSVRDGGDWDLVEAFEETPPEITLAPTVVEEVPAPPAPVVEEVIAPAPSAPAKTPKPKATAT